MTDGALSAALRDRSTGDQPEHLDVAVVGAGLSGIGAACYLRTKAPWASFAVFEARQAMGGTWDLFRYPGIRSDSDMFTLGYAFRPWDGEKAIADGASILRYIQETAAAYGIDERIRYGHRIVAADWSDAEARWHVTAERVPDGTTVEFTCGFLFACAGYYRYDHGYLPDFPGIEDYRGTVVHPQAWPEDLDVSAKRVVVIGSGATAVTLVPALAGRAGHVVMLQRSPSYVGSAPARNPVDDLLRKVLPARLSGPAIRWMHALFLQGFYRVSRRHPELVKRLYRARLRRELPAGYDLGTHFTPRYDPWDQRFCLAPDGDLFAAIRRGTASVVTDRIARFTTSGILLESGSELEADVVVTATGLELQFLGGAELSVDGRPLDLSGKLTYKGMMLQDVPNFALAIGYTNASWTLKVDLTCDYVCRILDHMHRRGWGKVTPVADGAASTGEPLMGLDAGYIRRAAHLLPRQGATFPWRVHQSFLRDFRAMKLSGVEGDGLVFSHPNGRAARGGPDDASRAAALEVGAPLEPVAAPASKA